MAKVKRKNKGKISFFMSLLDSFTAFIYSMLANGRLGTWFSSGDKSHKESFFSRNFEKVTRILQKSDKYGMVDLVMKNSRFAKASDAIREFLCRLSLATYGLFFAVYRKANVVFTVLGLFGDK